MSKTTIDKTTVDSTTVDSTTANAASPATEKARAGDERAKLRPIPCVKVVRRSLGLTQEEFAFRYGIPLGTLRDWEQGRTEPDRPARAYIRVIASNPEWVSRALAAESGRA